MAKGKNDKKVIDEIEVLAATVVKKEKKKDKDKDKKNKTKLDAIKEEDLDIAKLDKIIKKEKKKDIEKKETVKMGYTHNLIDMGEEVSVKFEQEAEVKDLAEHFFSTKEDDGGDDEVMKILKAEAVDNEETTMAMIGQIKTTMMPFMKSLAIRKQNGEKLKRSALKKEIMSMLEDSISDYMAQDEMFRADKNGNKKELLNLTKTIIASEGFTFLYEELLDLILEEKVGIDSEIDDNSVFLISDALKFDDVLEEEDFVKPSILNTLKVQQPFAKNPHKSTTTMESFYARFDNVRNVV